MTSWEFMRGIEGIERERVIEREREQQLIIRMVVPNVPAPFLPVTSECTTKWITTLFWLTHFRHTLGWTKHFIVYAGPPFFFFFISLLPIHFGVANSGPQGCSYKMVFQGPPFEWKGWESLSVYIYIVLYIYIYIDDDGARWSQHCCSKTVLVPLIFG